MYFILCMYVCMYVCVKYCMWSMWSMYSYVCMYKYIIYGHDIHAYIHVSVWTHTSNDNADLSQTLPNSKFEYITRVCVYNNDIFLIFVNEL